MVKKITLVKSGLLEVRFKPVRGEFELMTYQSDCSLLECVVVSVFIVTHNALGKIKKFPLILR